MEARLDSLCAVVSAMNNNTMHDFGVAFVTLLSFVGAVTLLFLVSIGASSLLNKDYVK